MKKTIIIKGEYYNKDELHITIYRNSIVFDVVVDNCGNKFKLLKEKLIDELLK